jgi:hypothetical protein
MGIIVASDNGEQQVPPLRLKPSVEMTSLEVVSCRLSEVSCQTAVDRSCLVWRQQIPPLRLKPSVGMTQINGLASVGMTNQGSANFFGRDDKSGLSVVDAGGADASRRRGVSGVQF